MDLKAHIQAARRAPSPSAPMPRHRIGSPEIGHSEIGGPEIGGARRRSIDRPEAPSGAVAASAAALALLRLATRRPAQAGRVRGEERPGGTADAGEE